MEPVTGTAVLSVRGLSKSFGSTRALIDVDLSVDAGQIRGLCGANGSGKSTLIKVLAGYHRPDDSSGATMAVSGRPVPLPAPGRALWDAGVRFVHQDLGLIDPLAVTENLFSLGWGASPRRVRRVPWARTHREAARILTEVGVEVDPRTPVKNLNGRDRVLVALARALATTGDGVASGLRVLCLDEATGTLGGRDAQHVRRIIREMADSGVAVLLVSHRMEELEGYCDALTVLRNGRVAREWSSAATASRELIVEAMVGGAVDQGGPGRTRGGREALAPSDEVIRLQGARLGDCASADLAVHRGEILGLTAGPTGGAADAARMLAGSGRPTAGRVLFGGRDVTRWWSTQRAAREGIALVPEDRLREGGFPTLTASENVTLVHLARAGLFRLRRRRAETARALELMTSVGAVPANPALTFRGFSGGNQQKLLFARAMTPVPAALVLIEPTSGVDVASRTALHAMIDALAEAGTAVALVTNDEGELERLCDRVLVFRDGRVSAELTGTDVARPRILEECLR